MIPPYAIETVYDLLSDQSSGSLDHTFKLFQKKFSQDSYNLFGPCFILLQALCDNVLTKGQRLLALYIINESFKSEKYNPFAVSLLDICEKAIDQFEKNMIYDIVVKGQREQYGQMSMKTILEEQDKFLENFKNEDEVESLRKSLHDQLQHIPTATQTQIRNIVPDSIYIDKKNEAPPQIPHSYKLQNLDKEFLGFEPDFLRPVPQLLSMSPSEVLQLIYKLKAKWLDLGIFLDVQWDYNICVNNNTLSIVKELMQKAYSSKLTADEIKALTEAFKKDLNYVKNCGLTTLLLPNLVEQNPTLASLILTKMVGQPNITEQDKKQYLLPLGRYFEKLCQIEVTLASLEVINKLANTVSLPKEFFHFFITNCIQQCNSQKEKATSNRLVRLVCVFIKAMIKHKNINPKELFIELQAFCIEYSKINEASNLFKLLKSIENEEKKTQGYN